MKFEFDLLKQKEISILSGSSKPLIVASNYRFTILYCEDKRILIYDNEENHLNEFQHQEIDNSKIKFISISPKGEFFSLCVTNKIFLIDAIHKQILYKIDISFDEQNSDGDEIVIEDCQFIDHYIFVAVFSNNMMRKFTIFNGTLGFAVLQNDYHDLSNKISKIVPTSTELTQSIVVGLLSNNQILVFDITNDEFSKIANIDVENCSTAYLSIETDSYKVAFIESNNLFIKEIHNDTINDLCTIQLKDNNITGVSFLTKSLILTISSENQISIYSMLDKELKNCVNIEGDFYLTNNSILSYTSNGKYTLFNLCSFNEILSQYQSKKLIKEGIELCRFVYNDENFVELYDLLPNNHSEKISAIQNEVSELLILYFTEEENILEVIEIAVSFNLCDFLQEMIPKTFPSSLSQVIKEMIKYDPTAQKMYYAPKFIDLICDAHNDLNCDEVKNFLLSLPANLLSTEYYTKILTYSQKINSPSFAGDLMVKINSPLKALSLYEMSGDNEKIFDILKEFSSPSIINWLFAHKNYEFPRLSLIVKSNSIFLLKKILNSQKIPFSKDLMINALLMTFSNEKVTGKSQFFKELESFIIKCDSIKKFSQNSLEYLTKKIFTDDYSQPDTREILLLKLLNLNVFPDEVSGLLYKKCSLFGFKEAKDYISNTNRYSGYILEDKINECSSNTIDWISFIYREDTKEFIEKVIIEKIDSILCLKDHHLLLSILPHDFIQKLIDEIKTPDLRFYFIHLIISEDLIVLICPYFIESLPFLSKFYKNDIFQVIKSGLFDDVHLLLNECDRLFLYDCCCQICVMNKLTENIENYLPNLILIDWKQKELILESTTLIFMNKSNHDYFDLIATTFAQLIEKERDDFEYLLNLYHEICEISLQNVGFCKVLQITREMFPVVGPDHYQQIIKSVLTCHKLNPDNLLELENNINSSQVPLASKHSICGSCKMPLFIEGIGIFTFECGHAVHNLGYCANEFKECPICCQKS
ncbi:hypothetical protein TRFO_11521 [Tritrichomonas foetus]|uniref:Uncharacterized protein n=1 Tax=Tritrichomonas foetus TaxID=1144522 RepID=A0A1J4J948_9EUKA|nr:hypothetical protein TRFO_11521 [Tritrichomonas foetus]|eukprot:OHS93748.1 hypothetical protein TRFO_11521 [Tritrichomonas foetus]